MALSNAFEKHLKQLALSCGSMEDLLNCEKQIGAQIKSNSAIELIDASFIKLNKVCEDLIGLKADQLKVEDVLNALCSYEPFERFWHRHNQLGVIKSLIERQLTEDFDKEAGSVIHIYNQKSKQIEFYQVYDISLGLINKTKRIWLRWAKDEKLADWENSVLPLRVSMIIGIDLNKSNVALLEKHGVPAKSNQKGPMIHVQLGKEVAELLKGEPRVLLNYGYQVNQSLVLASGSGKNQISLEHGSDVKLLTERAALIQDYLVLDNAHVMSLPKTKSSMRIECGWLMPSEEIRYNVVIENQQLKQSTVGYREQSEYSNGFKLQWFYHYLMQASNLSSTKTEVAKLLVSDENLLSVNKKAQVQYPKTLNISAWIQALSEAQQQGWFSSEEDWITAYEDYHWALGIKKWLNQILSYQDIKALNTRFNRQLKHEAFLEYVQKKAQQENPQQPGLQRLLESDYNMVCIGRLWQVINNLNQMWQSALGQIEHGLALRGASPKVLAEESKLINGYLVNWLMNRSQQLAHMERYIGVLVKAQDAHASALSEAFDQLKQSSKVDVLGALESGQLKCITAHVGWYDTDAQKQLLGLGQQMCNSQKYFYQNQIPFSGSQLAQDYTHALLPLAVSLVYHHGWLKHLSQSEVLGLMSADSLMAWVTRNEHLKPVLEHTLAQLEYEKLKATGTEELLKTVPRALGL